MNVTVFDWFQKEFSRQMRIAAGCWEEDRIVRVGRIPRRSPNRPAKTVSEGF